MMIWLLFVAILFWGCGDAQYVSTRLVKPMPAPLQFETYVLDPHSYRLDSINDTLAHMLLLEAGAEVEVAPRLSLQNRLTSQLSSGKLTTTASTAWVVNGFSLHNRTLTGLRMRVHLPAVVSTDGKTFTVVNEAATTTITFPSNAALPTNDGCRPSAASWLVLLLSLAACSVAAWA